VYDVFVVSSGDNSIVNSIVSSVVLQLSSEEINPSFETSHPESASLALPKRLREAPSARLWWSMQGTVGG
jgi:hypothetical protein